MRIKFNIYSLAIESKERKIGEKEVKRVGEKKGRDRIIERRN